MSAKNLVVGLAASVASVTVDGRLASAQVSTPALIVNAETSVLSRPMARSDIVEVVQPETVLEVIGHEGDWDWVILPPDVNGTRHSGWIQTRGLTPEKKLQMKQEREAAQKLKEEQAQQKQEEAQRLKEEQARLKQEQLDEQKREEAQKQAEKDSEQRTAKAKRELEKARREYEKVASRGVATNSPSADAPSNSDESNPLK